MNRPLRKHGVSAADRARGFSMLELLVVIAIMFIVGAMVLPSMWRINDNQKLRGGAQTYAYLVQLARTRAENDNKPYEVQHTIWNGATVVYVDLNDNQTYDPNPASPDLPEPSIQLPGKMTVTDTNAPVTGSGFDTIQKLGIIPLYAGTGTHQSPMVTGLGAASPGLAFNERGLPCQRLAAGASCLNQTTLDGKTFFPTAWISYLSYQNYGNTTSWAAVTVTPAGRIKTWIYLDGTWQ
jgi:prepilin-type N-terminal cleavage/methylation domain-containing protein